MLNQEQIFAAIKSIYPNAQFAIRGTEIEWLDNEYNQPTDAEIEIAWNDYIASEQAQAETKAAEKQALLNRLGITADEAKLLLS